MLFDSLRKFDKEFLVLQIFHNETLAEIVRIVQKLMEKT